MKIANIESLHADAGQRAELAVPVRDDDTRRSEFGGSQRAPGKPLDGTEVAPA